MALPPHEPGCLLSFFLSSILDGGEVAEGRERRKSAPLKFLMPATFNRTPVS